MIDGIWNKSHKLLAATMIFILGEYVTGISGSSPDLDRRLRFETLTGSWRQIPLAVNGLTREHSRRYEGRKVIQKRGPGQNIHQLSSVLEF